MTKRHSHKFRACRQLGVGSWFINTNDSKKVKLTKSPGEHGTSKKGSNNRYEPLYSTQLKEKQKLRKYYGEITEKQFFLAFQDAMRIKGLPSLNIFTLLERRLDCTVYRMGFASTIFEARQLVSHGHVFCNSIKVTVPSYKVKDGDMIVLSDNAIERIKTSSRKEIDVIPPYLEVDIFTGRGIFVRQPSIQEVPHSKEFNIKAVIEFYSK